MDYKILDYQKLDMKLHKIDKEIDSNKVKVDTEALSTSIKQWQIRILQLEEQAKLLLDELNKLLEVEKKGIALVQKLNATDISKMSPEELKDFDSKTSQTANNLADLDARIMQHNLQVKKVVFDYEMYRKKIIEAKQKRDQSKQEIDEVAKSKETDVDQFRDELANLEKTIDAKTLARYKTIKQDGIMPVFVPLVDKRCGGCRMELSVSALDKLKESGIYECEQCRRLIYLDEKK